MSLNLTWVCKRCGREYHPNSTRQMFCRLPTIVKCEICGKDIETICSNRLPRTCSDKCANDLANKSRTDAVSNVKLKCKWCGKEFVPKTKFDVYCRDKHYMNCVVCGKSFEMDPRHKEHSNTCSLECKKILSLQNRDIESEKEHLKQTLLSKYGVENPMQIPYVKDKMRETCKIRYGKDNYK